MCSLVGGRQRSRVGAPAEGDEEPAHGGGEREEVSGHEAGQDGQAAAAQEEHEGDGRAPRSGCHEVQLQAL